MAELKSRSIAPIQTELRVPGDEQISHRALACAALSNGPCQLKGFLPAAGPQTTVRALRQMGIEVSHDDQDPTLVRVTGCGGKLPRIAEEIDCGNELITLVLGIAMAAPRNERVVFWADEELSQKPLKRILEPLRALGVDIQSKGSGIDSAPLVVTPSEELRPAVWKASSALVEAKTAFLIAAHAIKGVSRYEEPFPTPNHTENILRFMHTSIWQDADRDTVNVCGPQRLESREIIIPGDISHAAPWLVLAAAREGAHLIVQNIGLNETRTTALGVLVRMGALIRERFDHRRRMEPMGRLEVRGSKLHGTSILGREVPCLMEEICVLAVAGALAAGRTTIRDAEELRSRRPDRIALTVKNLRRMGVQVKERDDGMDITGQGKLKAARVETQGDPRIGMAFAIAGLCAEGGETIIEDAEGIEQAYPGFGKTLHHLIATRIPKGSRTPVVTNLPNLFANGYFDHEEERTAKRNDSAAFTP